jgi:hypothetical protein
MPACDEEGVSHQAGDSGELLQELQERTAVEPVQERRGLGPQLPNVEGHVLALVRRVENGPIDRVEGGPLSEYLVEHVIREQAVDHEVWEGFGRAVRGALLTRQTGLELVQLEHRHHDDSGNRDCRNLYCVLLYPRDSKRASHGE